MIYSYYVGMPAFIAYICKKENEIDMSPIQKETLNDEIFRNLGIIADDENLLNRLAKYLRRIVKLKQDPALFTKEEFFHRIDESLEQAKQGKVTTFDNMEEMNAWLNTL